MRNVIKHGKILRLHWEKRAREAKRKNRSPSPLARFYYTTIQDTVQNLASSPLILKTDLWDHAIEPFNGNLEDLTGTAAQGEICGIDVSRFVCEEAGKKRLAKILVADIRALPFKDNVFDTLLDISTCDHISLDELPNCLQDYWRVLRENGKLFMVFNNCSLYSRTRHNMQPSQFRWVFPRDAVKKLFCKFFNVISERSIDTFGWIPFSIKIVERFPWLLNVLKTVETSCLSKKMALFSHSYMLVGSPIKEVEHTTD